MKYRRVCSLIWTSIKLCMVTVHCARVVFCLTLYRLQGVWKSDTIFRGHHGISKTINLSKNCQRGTTCKVPRYLQNKFHYNLSACLDCVTSRQTGDRLYSETLKVKQNLASLGQFFLLIDYLLLFFYCQNYL